jgi:hypothetical protein
LKLLEDGVQAAAMQPTDLAHALLAAKLATVPDDKLRNGKRALAIAQEVMKHTQEPGYLQRFTLAVALAETGDFDGATAELDQMESLELTEGQRQELDQLRSSFKGQKPWRMTPEKLDQATTDENSAEKEEPAGNE